MRKLIVSNLVTLDGYYEGKDKSLDALSDYFHDDYDGDQNFDRYQADILLPGVAQHLPASRTIGRPSRRTPTRPRSGRRSRGS